MSERASVEMPESGGGDRAGCSRSATSVNTAGVEWANRVGGACGLAKTASAKVA